MNQCTALRMSLSLSLSQHCHLLSVFRGAGASETSPAAER